MLEYMLVVQGSKAIAEMHISEVPADATERDIIKHYTQFARLFMSHLGKGVRVVSATVIH